MKSILGRLKLQMLTVDLSCFFALGIILFLSTTKAYNYLEAKIELKFGFYLREYLGRDPKLDKRIKVIAFDDNSINNIKQGDLSLGEWAKLFETLSQKKTAAIYVDKLFRFNNGSSRETKNFIDRISKLTSTNIYIGSFVTGEKIRGSYAIYPDEHPGKFIRLTQNDYSQENRQLFVYGPSQELAFAFKNSGHINVEEMSFIKPYYLVEHFAYPHMIFRLASNLEVKLNDIYVDGEKIPVNKSGLLMPNFVSTREIYGKAMPLLSFMNEKALNTLNRIEENDIVIILPAMFSGNSDFKDTPVGKYPGGFIITSLINSLIGKIWISFFPSNFLLILLFGLLPIGLHLLIKKSVVYAIINAGVGVAAILFSLGLFAFYSFHVPWLYPQICGITNFGILLLSRLKKLDEFRRKVIFSLSESLDHKQIEAIIAEPEQLNTKETQVLVTVMFIDMAGFSLIAESLTPEEVFKHLKLFMERTKEIIHRYGGVIDKNLGDGLLCFFGYSYIKTDIPSDSHPDMALKCASEIQVAYLETCLANAKNNMPVFPLRIGINTASVYIGNISGSNQQFNFTLVGHGVNYAKRMESACDVFKILLSDTTKSLLGKHSFNSEKFYEKKIIVKHREEPLSAYEFDPLAGEDQKIKEVMRVYQKLLGHTRKEQRWFFGSETKIEASTKFGTLQVVDFSLNGFAFIADCYLAAGVTIDLSLNNDELHGGSEVVRSLFPLTIEVKWSRPHGDKFIHGSINVSHNLHQKEILLTSLKTLVGAAKDEQPQEIVTKDAIVTKKNSA